MILLDYLDILSLIPIKGDKNGESIESGAGSKPMGTTITCWNALFASSKGHLSSRNFTFKKKKHHLSKCNWRFFTLCRPFSVTFNYIYKTPLFASKQKWFSSHNTLRNLLWGIFVLRNKRWYGRTCALSVYVINSFCHWLIVQLCPKSVDLWKIAWIIIITFNLVEKYLKDNSHLCFTHNLYLFKNSRILNVYVFLFEM